MGELPWISMLLLWQAGTLKGYTRLVQGDLQKAKDMWKNLRMDQCVRLPENAGLASDNLMDRQHAGMILEEVIMHGGIDQSPLYDLLAQYIDISLIYSSSIDFSLCTYSLRNRSSLKVWRSDIPRDHFFSYIMVSSALPGLRSVKLDNHVYLDGGIGDNFPYYLPVGDYQHLLAFFDDRVMPGLEQAALLNEMRRDRVYSAESVPGCGSGGKFTSSS